MDVIMFYKGCVFESNAEYIKKVCEKLNEKLKDGNITWDNIGELFIKEPGLDPLKVNEKELGSS